MDSNTRVFKLDITGKTQGEVVSEIKQNFPGATAQMVREKALQVELPGIVEVAPALAILKQIVGNQKPSNVLWIE
jgi:hypothetical protein